jgi:small conductance mechanosensitive channel
MALIIVLLQVVLSVQVGTDSPPPSTQPAAPTTQPTTQPVSLTEGMLNTRLGQIIQGKVALTWSDIRQPIFWVDTVRNLVETLLAFIPRLIGTIVFLLVFYLIYRGIRRLTIGNLKKEEVDSSIRDLIGSIIKWFVMGFGLVIACNQLGIPIVAMLTGVSIIGLAVGFAAQETLANFIAGIVIFLDQPFKVGHWITVDGVFAQVKRITFRSTRILTEDGETVIFPNTQMLSNKVINSTMHSLQRVNVSIGIAYGASIDKAREALLSTTREDPRVCKAPAPEVIVAGLGASSVDLVLRFWIEDESQERKVLYAFNEKAKKALDAAGVSIPFPHVQLLLEETPALRLLGTGAPKAS